MAQHNKKQSPRTDPIDAASLGAAEVNPMTPVGPGDETNASGDGCPLSDAELIARWQAGDQSALDTLLSRYEKPVYLFVLGLLRDSHTAEDVLQETFYTALTRLDEVDREHFRGWLFTVAYHQAMLERRRQTLRKRFGSASPQLDQLPVPGRAGEPWQQLQDQERSAQVHRWLRQLPQAQQEVIRLRLFEGLRFREIAERLGCPLGTALARWYQALKRLWRLADDTHPQSYTHSGRSRP